MNRIITTALCAGSLALGTIACTNSITDDHGEPVQVVVALPTADGGAHSVTIDAVVGQPVSVSNVDARTDRQLPTDGYTIEGTWRSSGQLALTVQVATTTSYNYREGEESWSPKVEMQTHTLRVDVTELNVPGTLRPADGGEPRAFVLATSAGETRSQAI